MTQPKNMTVRAGTTVMLRCEVLRPSGFVQWVKDGLLLGPQQSLPGFPRYSLLGDHKRGEIRSRQSRPLVRSRQSRPLVSSRQSHPLVRIPPSKQYFELETTEPWVAGKSYIVTCIAPDAKPELTGVESFPMSGSADKLQNTHATKDSSDNGRELVCRAKNPALPRALETSLVMNVYFPPQHPVIQGLFREGPVKRGTMLKLVCFCPVDQNEEVISTGWEMDTELQRAISHLTLQVKPQDNQAELRCESVNQVTPVPLSSSRKITVLCESPTAKRYINSPVHIRWWLGFRELNTTVVNVEEGDHGGKTTMSNLTHIVSREENGLPLTCETFNKGTRFSKSQSNNLIRPFKTLFLYSTMSSILSSTLLLLDYPKQVPSDKGVSKELVVRLQPSDNMATYRCNATNKYVDSGVLSPLLHPSLVPAVSVTIIAKQSELRRGQNLSLDCLPTKCSPLISPSPRLKGVDQAPRKTTFGDVSVRSTLSLPLSSQHHGQRITCQAYSSLLSEGVNTFYKLNVLYPPELSPDHPQKIQVVEDETAILPLLVSANPDDISCKMDPRYHFTESTEFEIWNVTRRDTGVYTVNCTNEVGLTIPPSLWTYSVSPVYVDVGETADLFCVADANPIINTDMGRWRRWEAEATRAHAGRYQCTADNNIAPPASVAVQLVVRFKPELQKWAQWNKVASRGDSTRTAEVVCQGEGIPRLHFSWAKNYVYQEKTIRDGSLHTSTVTVVNVSAALGYAVFTCTARNVQLLSTNQPDPPSEFHLVSFTHASATLEWIPGFDGGLEQRFRVSFLYVDVFPPRANIFIVTGLSPNSVGESGYADNNSVLTITTKGQSRASSQHDFWVLTRGLSLYQTVIMVVVGRAPLLAINWLGCFLCLRWKKRCSVLSVISRSTVFTARGSTGYEVRELVNPAAQRTLLIDSRLEPDSSVYGSYAGESSHYYYPTSDYCPSLYPHPEGAQGQGERNQNTTYE
uniref:NPHS1 adhesion molecule, nephrin n=1 Tax=Salmo trutta TaxID=8032 RepID=A0A673Z6V6_SALTR